MPINPKPHELELIQELRRCDAHDQVTVEVRPGREGMVWVVLTNRKSRKVLTVPQEA